MRRLLFILLLGSVGLALSAPPTGIAVKSTTVLVDDFEPQPVQGDPLWFYNRLGGDRGQVDGWWDPSCSCARPGGGSLSWGNGQATASITQTQGTEAWVGVWTSLNHPVSEGVPLNFASIFPSQIKSQFQGQVTGLRVQVLDGQGTLQAEVQEPDLSFSWKGSVELSGGQQDIQFALPALGESRNLNWIVKGGAGDFVVVDRVELIVDVPQLDTPNQAFLWSYSMLLSNWDAGSGLTRDRGNFPSGDFDNVSASGAQAAAAAMAWDLGFISKEAATDIVEDTAAGLQGLARCHGLWPHFVRDGQITPDTEWSSVDTTIAIIALLDAQEALGLATSELEQMLEEIDWADLLLPNGSISHGYEHDCGQRLEAPWDAFGTESWLANYGYAAATGDTAVFLHDPPTWNGSGFIDELAWLLIPPPSRDRWGTDWAGYRQQAADSQLDYYLGHACYSQADFFGLSAAEVPDPASVDPGEVYQAFGVGGMKASNDESPSNKTPSTEHNVITPHYAGMISSLRPDEAYGMWEWMETAGLFTPLNNVESFMFIDAPICEEIVWNSLKGSWNLGLQTLGWGYLLAGKDNPLHNAVRKNDFLRQGYFMMWEDPASDPDGDTILNESDPDDDNDGCSDLQEIGSDQVLGGLRDPQYFWDFFDAYTGAPAARDGSVTVGDIGAVVARFGSFVEPLLTKEEAFAQALTVPADMTSYHAAFDRGAGTTPGQNIWNALPPDGSVTVGDIGAVVGQFGHACA